MTIDKKGIPKLIIVKIVMNEGVPETIYATLEKSWESFERILFFRAKVIDGCEDLHRRYITFYNKPDQKVIMSRIDAELPNTRSREKFRHKIMTLCTPLDLIKNARILGPM